MKVPGFRFLRVEGRHGAEGICVQEDRVHVRLGAEVLLVIVEGGREGSLLEGKVLGELFP